MAGWDLSKRERELVEDALGAVRAVADGEYTDPACCSPKAAGYVLEAARLLVAWAVDGYCGRRVFELEPEGPEPSADAASTSWVAEVAARMMAKPPPVPSGNGVGFSVSFDGAAVEAAMQGIEDATRGIHESASRRERLLSGRLEVGDDVLYRIGGTDAEPVLRSARVVRTWPEATYVNLLVFLDGANDAPRAEDKDPVQPYYRPRANEAVAGLMWRTSVHEGEGLGQCRRPWKLGDVVADTEAVPVPPEVA